MFAYPSISGWTSALLSLRESPRGVILSDWMLDVARRLGFLQELFPPRRVSDAEIARFFGLRMPSAEETRQVVSVNASRHDATTAVMTAVGDAQSNAAAAAATGGPQGPQTWHSAPTQYDLRVAPRDVRRLLVPQIHEQSNLIRFAAPERVAKVRTALLSYQDLAVLEAAGDLILDGQYPLFGGTHVIRGGSYMDWHASLDGPERWPRTHWTRVYYRSTDRPGDIKLAWELNRLEFLIMLGRAYSASGDERYSEGFGRLVQEWVDENSPEVGMPFARGIEVAARTFSLLAGYAMVHQADGLPSQTSFDVVRMLIANGRHLARRLQVPMLQRHAHERIAIAAALTVVGLALSPVDEAQQWYWKGLTKLRREMRRQHRDGTLIGGAPAADAVALEALLVVIAFMDACDQRVPQDLEKAAARLAVALHGVRAPDGQWPALGEGCLGRLMPLGPWTPRDFDPLLWTAAVRLNLPGVLPDSQLPPEDVLWLAGVGRTGRFLEAMVRQGALEADTGNGAGGGASATDTVVPGRISVHRATTKPVPPRTTAASAAATAAALESDAPIGTEIEAAKPSADGSKPADSARNGADGAAGTKGDAATVDASNDSNEPTTGANTTNAASAADRAVSDRDTTADTKPTTLTPASPTNPAPDNLASDGLAAFPNGGYATWRRGPRGRRDFAVMWAGAPSECSHPANLHVMLALANRPVLVGPGTFTFQGHIAWRDYFRTTPAYNTALADERPQGTFTLAGDFLGRLRGRQLGARDAVMAGATTDASETVSVMAAEVPAGGAIAPSLQRPRALGMLGAWPAPLRHRRVVFARDGLVVLADILVDPRPTTDGIEHKFEVQYHTPPGECAPEPEAGDAMGAYFRVIASGELRAHMAAQVGGVRIGNAEMTIARGSWSPLLGWHAPVYAHRMPAPCILIEVTGDLPIVVWSAFAAPIQAVEGDGAGQSTANTRGGMVTFGGVESSGRSATLVDRAGREVVFDLGPLLNGRVKPDGWSAQHTTSEAGDRIVLIPAT